MSRLNKILLLYFLFHKILCCAVDLKSIDRSESISSDKNSYEYMQCFNQIADSKLNIANEDGAKKNNDDSSLDLNEIESNTIDEDIKDTKKNLLIYELCNDVLKEKDFFLQNGNWLVIKIFLALLAPLTAGTSNLSIAINDKITADLIILTQFTVPLYINNVFKLLDKSRLFYKKHNFKKDFLKLCENLHISVYICLNLLASICLSYIASMYNFKLSGNAYEWIFSNFTESTIILLLAFYFGYISKILFLLPLQSVFFFNLIEEFFTKTGIGGYCKILPAAKTSLYGSIYKKHIEQISKEIKNDNYDYSRNIFKKYLSENRLNTTLDVANLKLYCFDKDDNNKKVEYIILNVFKLVFIVTATLVCGEAFKTIFTSKILLKEYIETFGNNNDGNYTFRLKDNSLYTCYTTANCIKNLDFSKITLNKEEIEYVQSANRLISIAYILSGIAISSNVATLLIDLTHHTKKIIKNDNFRTTMLSSLLRKQNIMPFLFSTFLCIPCYFYMENIYNVLPLAEKADDLLQSVNKRSFMPVNASMMLSMFYIGITFMRGTAFLVDISRLCLSYLGFNKSNYAPKCTSSS